MRHMDLFSGIGGFALAASWVWGDEHEIVTFCEKEEFPRQVLKKHWPSVPCHPDIYTMNGGSYGTVDLVTGGFPCQPFSTAGNQKGKEDDRYLWPETLRIIQESKPRWFIGENVAGIINMALDEVLASLESAGYASETFIIPACAVNAIHRRDRVWIVANINDSGNSPRFGNIRENESRIQEGTFDRRQSWNKFEGCCQDDVRQRFEFTDSGETDGVSCGMAEFKALGNAIVPQVAAVIMAGMKEVDRVYNNRMNPTQKCRGENSAHPESPVAAPLFAGYA